MGSFLNVVIHRLPLRRSVVTPRSACPGCGRPIPWHENLPVLSWILLGGKCRGCAGRISLRYPAVELLTGVLFVVAVHLLVLRHPGGVFRPGLWLHFGIVAPTLAALVALTFIDLDHRILPDRITKPGMAAGAVASLLLPGLQPTGWIPSLPPAGAALLLSGAGMVLGYGSLWSVGWLGERVFRKEAMGLGDAKLLAMIGAFTGPVGVLHAAAIGLFLGLGMGLAQRLRTDDPTFPFGPALAAGGAAVLLAPRAVGEGFVRASGLASDPRGGLGLALLCGVLLVGVRGRLPRALFLAFLALVALLAALNGILLVRGS